MSIYIYNYSNICYGNFVIPDGHRERCDTSYFAARKQWSQGHQNAATDATDCLGSDGGAELPVVRVPWVLLTARVLLWPSPKVRRAELEVYQE